ncbi:MAG: response regulator [Gammaproteobacteria bacterium]|nr:response regulator [Gammaproteobacteria bacterium]MBU1655312.1 response regulator [Gammaproteobacteria bacterium]MBU1961457.1 response regulator [Gammaproteobacteria bacterium]
MAKILTVDDSRSIRQMVSLTLRTAGYDVVEAADGVEALEYASRNSVDLAIIDVNMPRLDGIALTRKLRELANWRFTPILILTTESSQERKQEGRAAGATGWIVKPFDPDSLLATIRKVMR